MGAVQVSGLCLAYCLGLLLTGIPGQVLGVPTGAIVMLFAGAIAAVMPRSLIPQRRRMGTQRYWLLAGLIGFAAVMQFNLRLPAPAAHDICHLIKSSTVELCQPIATAQLPAHGVFEIKGKIATAPRLTRSDRYRFYLDATEVSATDAGKTLIPAQATVGTVYVTLPRSQGEALYPGQRVVLQGSLYKPKPAANPGGFDFQKFLARSGVFTGLVGQSLQLRGEQPDPPILWSIQRRIVRSQEMQLGVAEGHLISAMVMGKSAVDVPYDLQDQFRRAGLAHALAASGAQVSLLISVVLALTQRLPAKLRLGMGSLVIAGYLGLTGIEPSVLRAAVMGGVVLVALTLERQVKPLGSLLFAATLLLLWNPLWIWDLGFQLSFLATLGLLVTVPRLTQRLDWLPSAIASLVAVPIAAYLWTIPLQLLSFGVVSPYSILVNVLVSLLIAILSLGGMISGLAALLHPLAGGWSAWLLHCPAWLVIKIAALGNQLPGNQYAVGTIAVWQVLLLYGLILLIWRWQRSQPHWWLAGVIGVSLIAIPAWTAATQLRQVTVLATAGDPVLVIRDRGNVILVNSGSEKEVQFTLLPFFQKQGISHIDWAIAPHLRAVDLAGWKTILQTLPIGMFYSNPAAAPAVATASQSSEFPRQYRAFLAQVKAHQGEFMQISSQQPLQLGAFHFKLLTANASALQLQVDSQNWLFLNHLRSKDYAILQSHMLQSPFQEPQALWWTGALNPTLLEQIKPKTAIAAQRSAPDSATQAWFDRQQVQLYSMAQTGAVQWTPQQGFSALLDDG